MTKNFTLGTLSLALAMLLGSVDVAALTLGRGRSTALLGQPLDMVVPVQVDADEALDTVCFAADVFYGDIRVDSNLVTLTLQTGAVERAATLRIVASVKVDEPVVTVYLKAVCGQKASRRYVFLSDLPSEVVSVPPQTLPQPIQSTPAPVSPVALLPANSKPDSVAVKSEVQRMPVVSLAQNKTRTTATVPKQAPAVAERRPRLKLAPLDIFVERDLVLKSSGELSTRPTEDRQKRAESFAMWRSLNMSAQDVLRDEARVQALEGDIKRLGDLTSANKLALQSVAERLERSEEQRFANPLVYGLAVALMVCLAGLLLLWQRLRVLGKGDLPWWGGGRGADHQPLLPEAVVAAQDTSMESEANNRISPETASPAVASSGSATGSDMPAMTGLVDIDLKLLGESVFDPVDELGAASAAPEVLAQATRPTPVMAVRSDSPPSVFGTLRAINTKEMLDVRQQAEFFMTLGQYEEAIRLLEGSIQSADASNPLLYLDLLKIFHTLSRKTEFDKYRSAFNHRFTGMVPAYAEFNRPGRSLDTYPDLCDQLSKLWPSEDVVRLIEHSMIRNPAELARHDLDLEAFKDLLMLHGVVRRLDVVGFDSGLAPFSAAHALPPSAVPTLVTLTETTVAPKDSVAKSAPAQDGVDLDLSTGAGNLMDFDVSDYVIKTERDPGRKPPVR